jgi:hypothetical protein
MLPYPMTGTHFIAKVPSFLVIPEVRPGIEGAANWTKPSVDALLGLNLGNSGNRTALGRLKRYDWRKIAKSTRKNVRNPSVRFLLTAFSFVVH